MQLLCLVRRGTFGFVDRGGFAVAFGVGVVVVVFAWLLVFVVFWASFSPICGVIFWVMVWSLLFFRYWLVVSDFVHVAMKFIL